MLSVPVSERDHIQGPADAAITLVEYADFECPYCGEAYSIVKEIQRQLGSQLRFVYRHFPLSDVHPHARHAAEAAEAAGVQGKFWEMHTTLFEHQEQLDDASLEKYAATLHCNVEQFHQGLLHHTFMHRVQEDFEGGRHSHVGGTPTFFINGERHDDTYKLDVLLAAIKEAIASK